MDNIKTLLGEEIEDQLNELSGKTMGSEEYKTSVDGVVKLLDRKIEMDKMAMEAENNERAREHEESIKSAEIADEKHARLFRNILDVAGIVVPVGLTIWGTLKSFEFEKEGTVTTIVGRGFINKLLPKK